MRDKNNCASPLRKRLADPSLLTLLGSNVITIVMAVAENWRILDVLWIYWCQSLTIGWFSWLRMRQLKRFSSDGLKIGGSPVPNTPEAARTVANTMCGALATFHLVYIVFLVVLTMESGFKLTRHDLLGMAACLGSFVINHWFSYRHNLEDDLSRTPNIGNIGCMPLARILPMHLTIIACGGLSHALGQRSRMVSAIALIIFLGLKTLVDLFMHVMEHQETNREENHPSTSISP